MLQACPQIVEASPPGDDKEGRRWLAFEALFAEEWPRIAGKGKQAWI